MNVCKLTNILTNYKRGRIKGISLGGNTSKKYNI